MFGDGAAALDGRRTQDVIAEFKGSFSHGPRLRRPLPGRRAKYDRQWEERWISDVGFGQFIPEAINGLCEKYGVAPGDFAKIIYPCYFGGARKSINKKLGLEPDKVVDNLQAVVATPGTAQPLMMLVKALEERQAGRQDTAGQLRQRLRRSFLRGDRQASTKLKPRRGVIGQPGAARGPRQLREVPDLAPHGDSRYRPARRGAEVDALVAHVEVAQGHAEPGRLEVHRLRNRRSSRRRGYA